MWTHRLEGLLRPEFHLYDRDEPPSTTSHNQVHVNSINRRQNAEAHLTNKREMENYIHRDTIDRALGVQVRFNDFDDVPEIVAEQLHVANGGASPWAHLSEEKRKKKTSNAKRKLCTTCASLMNSALLTQVDPHGEVVGWLTKIKQLYEQPVE